MPTLSWKQIIAPWLGAGAGFAAAHGFALSSDQTAALTGIAAAAVGGAVHWLETKFLPAKPSAGA